MQKHKLNFWLFLINLFLLLFFFITIPILNLLLGRLHYNYSVKSVPRRMARYPNMNSLAFFKDKIAKWKAENSAFNKLKFPILEVKPKEYKVLGASNNQLCVNVYEQPTAEKWVIVCHGWTECKFEVLHIANMYYDWGYNVIVYDARTHGASDAKNLVCTVGYMEKLDLIKIFQWAHQKLEAQKILLHGQSMGAATCVEATKAMSVNDQKLVQACVIDGCFDDLDRQVVYVAKLRFKISPIFYHFGIKLAFSLSAHFKLNKVIPATNLDLVKNVPFLIIHGEADFFVPTRMSRHIYQEKIKFEKPVRSEIYLVPEAGHVLTYRTDPLTYYSKVQKFLKTQAQ